MRDDDRSTPPDGAPAIGPASLAAEIALLVDDDPPSIAPLIEALESARVTALLARDGLAALRVIERVSPDVILLDARMAGLDGFETCRRIKALPRFAYTPVIFMTGLSDTASVLAGLQAGGVDYLTKPIRPDELVARVAVHVANARLVRAAHAALEATAGAILALAPDGRLVWASPAARSLVNGRLGEEPEALAERPELRSWLAAIAVRAWSEVVELCLAGSNGALSLAAVGRSPDGALFLRASASEGEGSPQRLALAFGLSQREAEVLVWLARGKSNRDIAQILGLSPRTVMKHLERIFTKLGVENRTAAAAAALRRLG